jgi:hypothetical protein
MERKRRGERGEITGLWRERPGESRCFFILYIDPSIRPKKILRIPFQALLRRLAIYISNLDKKENK